MANTSIGLGDLSLSKVLEIQNLVTATECVFGGSLITAIYDWYEIRGQSFVVSTNSATIQLQTSSDGGATWDSGAANYAYGFRNSSSGTSSDISGTGTFVNVTNLLTNAIDGAHHVRIELLDPLNASYDTCFMSKSSHIDNGGAQGCYDGSFRRNSAGQADNGVRLFPSAGTFSGKFVIIGHKYA